MMSQQDRMFCPRGTSHHSFRILHPPIQTTLDIHTNIQSTTLRSQQSKAVNMSFARAFSRKVLPLNRTRLFTTTPYVQKTATEQAKETIQKVNKAVSEPLVKGIEKGRKSDTLPPTPLTSRQSRLLQAQS